MKFDKEKLHETLMDIIDEDSTLINEAPEDDDPFASSDDDDMDSGEDDDPFASSDDGEENSEENSEENDDETKDGEIDFSNREQDEDFINGVDDGDSVVLNGVAGAVRFDKKKVEEAFEQIKPQIDVNAAADFEKVLNIYQIVFSGYLLVDSDFEFDDLNAALGLVNLVNSKLDVDYSNYASLKIKAKLIEMRDNVKLDKLKKDDELTELRDGISIVK